MLVAVAGVLITLAVIAITIFALIRLDTKARANLIDRAQNELIADGLVRLIAWQMAHPAEGAGRLLSLAADGGAQSCAASGKTVTFAVTDVAGLFDLNAAPMPLLERLIVGLGLSASEAARIAAAIADYRDADDVSRVGGAEADAYRAASLPHGPKNAPFETTGELDQVLGVSRALYERMRPLVTVHSGLPGLSATAMPPEIVAILNRRAAAPQAAGTSAELDVPGEFLQPTPARTFRIWVQVAGPLGVALLREAVVELTKHHASGFIVRSWSTPLGGRLVADHPSSSSCIEQPTARAHETRR